MKPVNRSSSPDGLAGVVVFSGHDTNQSAYVVRLEPDGGNQ